MTVAYFLCFWGIIGMVFTGICWFGCWIEGDPICKWQWSFVVCALATMLGSAL